MLPNSNKSCNSQLDQLLHEIIAQMAVNSKVIQAIGQVTVVGDKPSHVILNATPSSHKVTEAARERRR